MQVKSIAEYSKGSILQYFQPSLSCQLSLTPLFCLFLSGSFTQDLLYFRLALTTALLESVEGREWLWSLSSKVWGWAGFVCLILCAPSTIFQLNRDGSSWVEPVLSLDKCVLLKDRNAVTLVRFEPVAPRYRVKHSITEPLRSLGLGWGWTHNSCNFLAMLDLTISKQWGTYEKFRHTVHLLEQTRYIENTRWVSFDIKFTRQGFENACWHH